MPLLKKRLQSDAEEKQRIRNKVDGLAFRPSEKEAGQVREISEQIANEFRDEISTSGFTEDVKTKIKAAVARLTEEMKLDYETQRRIELLSIANITGLGPIEPYIADPTVTEIIVQK